MPQWLLDAFDIRDENIKPTHLSSYDEDIVSARSHQLNRLVAGGICKDCNNGWMSSLEVEAMPLLINLFKNETSVVDLNQSQRFTIARWAMKTALTLNHSSNFLKSVPKAHFSHLYSHPTTLPENVVVFAQNHDFNQNFYWLQSSTWIVHDADDIADEATKKCLQEKGYKIAFQFRGLLIVVAFNPLDEFLFCLWKGIHVPLYPMKGRIAYFDRDGFPWTDSKKAIYAFHIGLELAYNNT